MRLLDNMIDWGFFFYVILRFRLVEMFNNILCLVILNIFNVNYYDDFYFEFF